METFTIEFLPHEIERLIVLRDHLAGTIHRPNLSFDEMVRWSLEAAGNQFNLGPWPQIVFVEGLLENPPLPLSEEVGPSLGEDGEPETKLMDESGPLAVPPDMPTFEPDNPEEPSVGPGTPEEPTAEIEPGAEWIDDREAPVGEDAEPEELLPVNPPDETEVEKPSRRSRRAQE